MLFKEQLVPLLLSLGVLLIATVVYQEFNLDIEAEFSYNLKRWFNKGKYFIYDSHKVFYVYEELEQEKWAEREPTIVLLHGFPTSSFDYLRIWNQFMDKNSDINQQRAKTNSILAFDFLGYGFSDKPQNYTYSIFDMADMVEKLILHLDIQSIVLVAHDMSDSVAQEILRRDNLKTTNHYKIDKCILMNGGIMTSIYQPFLSQHVMRTEYLSQIVYSRYLFRFSFFKIGFSPLFGNFKQPNQTEFYDFYLGIKYNHGNERLPQTVGYMKEREEFGSIWYDALNETSLPVLFIYGPNDPINPRDKFPQKLREDLPRVKLSILSEMVGHYPQFEDSFTVFQLIKNFL